MTRRDEILALLRRELCCIVEVPTESSGCSEAR